MINTTGRERSRDWPDGDIPLLPRRTMLLHRERYVLEPAGDGVGVGWLSVLPAEQPAVILVVRAEVFTPLIEHLDVHPPARQG
jgi:hypothetical protein